jgi:mannose-6-phosphate isomerase
LKVFRLKNTIQEYVWGSPTFIPELLGTLNPEGRPKAEMWMGTHPKAPSTVIDENGETTLPDLIAGDPPKVLGESVADRFNGQLPFLFKVLAASQALSIQAHPNLSQARAGYDRENKKGVALDAWDRNYRDPNHKPEIICALTPFWAMCGFRPIDEIVTNLDFLTGTVLDKAFANLKKKPGEKALRRFFESLITLGKESAGDIVDAACRGAATRNDDSHGWVTKLNKQQPGDVGVICPLLLNTYHLEPGQAMFQGAGELHAYLEGLGIELMANSDNVLRGGLTTKYVDPDELLQTLTFDAQPAPILTGREVSPGTVVYDTPAKEFSLSRITVTGEIPYDAEEKRNVEIFIVTEGSCLLRAGASDGMEVAKGESVLVPANSGSYRISGSATLFRATVP